MVNGFNALLLLLLEIQVIWQLLLLLYYITQDQRYLPTTPPTRQHRPPPQGNHPLPYHFTVLGYNLPPSFDTLAAAAKENEEAKSMIELGYFHAIGKSLIQSYRENKLPLPDPAKPLDAFLNTYPDG